MAHSDPGIGYPIFQGQSSWREFPRVTRARGGKEPDEATETRLPVDPGLRAAETMDALEKNAHDEAAADDDAVAEDDDKLAGEDVTLPPNRLDDEGGDPPGEPGTAPSEPPG